MLTKIGNVLVDEKKIPKYKKFSFFAFIVGFVLFFALPFLASRIFITEKQVKNSEIFQNQLTYEFFFAELEKLNQDLNFLKSKTETELNSLIMRDNNDYHLIEGNFIKDLFFNLNDNNEIKSVEVNSQRGERLKFIMFNIIYDTKEFNSENNLLALMAFINHFSYNFKSNYYWLSKDVQFNFIKRDFFYKNPKMANDLLTTSKNNKIKEGQLLDFIVNIDTIKLNFRNFLFKINGESSEIVDMDFYKIFLDNLVRENNEKRIQTFDSYFSTKVRKNMMKIYSQFSDVIKIFATFVFPTKEYLNSEYNFVYFIENIFENYLHANENLDTNHLMISNGFNSILISGTNAGNYISYDIWEKFLFFQGLERIVKIFSKCETDLFRGDHNYILVNNKLFINLGLFIFVPVLMVIRIVYEILGNIYSFDCADKVKQNSNEITNKNLKIKFSKIITVLLISFTFQLIIFFHIEQLTFILKFPLETIFYITFVINFLLTFGLFFCGKFNKAENEYCDNIFRFLFALNSFNFLFINYGMGLLIIAVFLPLEMIFIKFSKNLVKFSILLIILYILLHEKSFVIQLITNYIGNFNNVYPIYSTVLAMLICRINLILSSR